MQDYYICNRLDLLTWYNGAIPEDKVYVKVGGDHGKGNMKFEYFQIGNVLKPNSSKKTVVFTIFEAKDTWNNLRTITSRYKEQLEDPRSTKWEYVFFMHNLIHCSYIYITHSHAHTHMHTNSMHIHTAVTQIQIKGICCRHSF